LVVDLICSEDRGTMYQRFRGLEVSLPFVERATQPPLPK
jgi:hypothetical protein